LEVLTEVVDGVTVHRVTGRVDVSTSRNFESAIRASIGGHSPRIILDMRELTFIASTGLRLVAMAARQAAAAQGGLAIFGLRPAVNEVFEISGLQKVILIASDETEARSKLGL
jgi:anti-sigma B factor antagonist